MIDEDFIKKVGVILGDTTTTLKKIESDVVKHLAGYFKTNDDFLSSINSLENRIIEMKNLLKKEA